MALEFFFKYAPYKSPFYLLICLLTYLFYCLLLALWLML